MRTSFALSRGVLWVARTVKTGRVTPFDVNGRPLGPGFSFAGLDGGPTEIRGLAVDDDRRLWIADAASGSLRGFSAFGAEIAPIRSGEEPEADRVRAFGDSAGIAAGGVESEARLLVSRRGTRRHALQLVDPSRGTVDSLRPDGEPDGRFLELAGVALVGRWVYACETGRRAVQVFRAGAFHYRIAMPASARGLAPFVPRAVAGRSDGRTLVACDGPDGGGVFLFDGGGGWVRSFAVEPGGVDGPFGIAIHEGADDHSSLVLVLDRDGERVQALTLEGASLGCFPALVGPDEGGGALPSRAAGRRERRPPTSG